MSDYPKSEPANAAALPIVKNIFDVSAEFLGQYKTWLEQNPPSIPVTQILGFSQFVATPATTAKGAASTSSTSYVTTLASGSDLTGPSLTGLSNGKYLFLYGARMSGNVAYLTLEYNGVGPANDDDAATVSLTAGSVSVARATVSTLASGNNTVDVAYRTDNAGVACSVATRWLIALRIANS